MAQRLLDSSQSSIVSIINRVMPLVVFATLLFSLLNSEIIQAKEKKEELNLKQMLLMPDEVTLAHAELETKCESCHVHFDKNNQSPLCIDCHKVVKEEINVKLGFHGKLSTNQLSTCYSCHTEHKGRSFDITGLDKDVFDHNKTDFPLAGKHQATQCDSCHQKDKEGLPDGIKELPVDKAFRFKEFQCSSCHEDFHKTVLGDQCEDCHTEKNWTISAFNHDETNFQLVDAHSKAECESCHVDNQFKLIEPECKSCHLAADSHLGVFGDDCTSCHSPKKWTDSSFNHSTDTESKLVGKHDDLSCISCHEKEEKPASECIDCHKNDDIHQSKNGAQCQDCHNQNLWVEITFEHEIPLTGNHLDLACTSCHTPGVKHDESITQSSCIDCHRSIDPHKGKLGQRCQACHQTTDWQKSVSFSHDFSNFPLTGSHQLLVCEACHVSVDFAKESDSCVSCHSNDDYHQQILGNKCETCHNSSVWSNWKFDHDLQTEYGLTGAHENLKCDLCHDNSLPEPLKPGKQCEFCHLVDDVHSGSFGTDCKQCHNTVNFQSH